MTEQNPQSGHLAGSPPTSLSSSGTGKAPPSSGTYEFHTAPYDHQRSAFNKTVRLKYAALFMEQGTGKTKVAIDRTAAQFEMGKIDAALTIAPNSLLETWNEEITTHLPERISRRTVLWDTSRITTKKHQADLEAVLKNDNPALLPWLIINVEGLTKRAQRVLSWWCQHRRIAVIIDESTTIKTPSAQRTKAAQNVSLNSVSRLILSGLPVTNNPADYYSQLCALTRSPLGFNNYFSFRARYCEVETKLITFAKPRFDKKTKQWTNKREVKVITGSKNSEELLKRLEPFSVFVKKKDCLDLPDKIYHQRLFDLSKEEQRVYNSVKTQIITQLDEDRTLTIEYALAKLVRLQQVTGGFLPDDDNDNPEPIAEKISKLQLLCEVLEQFPGPALIWCRFKAEQQAVMNLLIDSKRKAEFIVGSVSTEDRDKARTAFQNGDLQYLVCSQQCAGYGYTLTAAENEIYYSNSFSLEHREQSEDRAHRIGQTKNVNIIDLLGRKTIDEHVLKVLKKKKDMADEFTDIERIRGLL